MSLVVLIKDGRSRYLSAGPSFILLFSDSNQGDYFVVQMRDNSVSLLHEKTGRWVGIEAGKPRLQQSPAAINMFVNPERLVAFRSKTGEFLASDRSTDQMVAMSGPLRRDREAKLFTLIEVAMPQHALLAWPVRVHLRTRDGLYLSNTNGSLAANSQVACCSEEFVLDLNGWMTGQRAGSGRICSSIWSSDATELVSVEQETGRLLFRSQHSCLGYENFVFKVHRENRMMIHYQGENDRLENIINERPCLQRYLHVKKTMEIEVELTRKPLLLITAQGTLMGAGEQSSGILALRSMTLSNLDNVVWSLRHHGEGLYTFQHVESSQILYWGNSGELQFGRSDGAIQYPDKRTLFLVELRETAFSFNDVTNDNARRYTSGFRITSVKKVDGRNQFCMTTLPDGRIASARVMHPTCRWDLFSLVDLETAKNSAIQPLQRLPAQNDDTMDANATMPRSKSCIVLGEILERTGEERMEGDEKLGWPIPYGESLRERRCVSEISMFEMQYEHRPLNKSDWLAEVGRKAVCARGWGVRSAATMQEAAVNVCASGILTRRMAFQDMFDTLTLPWDMASCLAKELELMTAIPKSTKLSYIDLLRTKSAGPLPSWIAEHVSHTHAPIPEEVEESYVCAKCKGSTGLLLPLDPEVNPQHYKFLEAMERRQFGRQRRRVGRDPDPLTVGIQIAKTGLILFGTLKVLNSIAK